ncbi:hypothetical protein ECC02_006578 [Trypanosoma cruzi]|uniref:Uncharacterized protein n=1 Tax=Trypanosoma cruzi TaxID=5693 RepID=A0A7J6Y0X3_TRYCR|nr:hypothetical protein ECC02_006578 [Trypanosoma cruzi]
MDLVFVRVVLCLWLLFLPTCKGAWSLWVKSSSRSDPVKEGGAAATSVSGHLDDRVQIPDLFTLRQKKDAGQDRQAAHLLNELEKKGRISSCWKRAVDALKEGCSSLHSDDGARSRLALTMASCDGEADGGRRAWSYCAFDTDVRKCVDHLDDAQYLMYVQYRLHADVLCLYIQEEAFQERTEMAVQALYASALAASETLQALRSSSSELHSSVRKTVEQQASNLVETSKLNDQLRDLRSGQSLAFESLRSSTEGMARSLTDARLSLNELHMALYESTAQAAAAVREVAREATAFQKRTEDHANTMVRVLERIEVFQQGILEKTIGLSEMIRAAVILVILLLLTIPTRTAAARRPCIGVVALAYALRPLFLPYPRSGLGNNFFFATVILISGIILVFFAYTHRSPEYTLRMMLRSELRHVVEYARPLFLESVRQVVIEGVTFVLHPLEYEKEAVQPRTPKETALLLASEEARAEETCTPPTVAKPQRKATHRRTPSRLR